MIAVYCQLPSESGTDPGDTLRTMEAWTRQNREAPVCISHPKRLQTIVIALGSTAASPKGAGWVVVPYQLSAPEGSRDAVEMALEAVPDAVGIVDAWPSFTAFRTHADWKWPEQQTPDYREELTLAAQASGVGLEVWKHGFCRSLASGSVC